jgi:hypothetical protein
VSDQEQMTRIRLSFWLYKEAHGKTPSSFFKASANKLRIPFRQKASLTTPESNTKSQKLKSQCLHQQEPSQRPAAVAPTVLAVSVLLKVVLIPSFNMCIGANQIKSQMQLRQASRHALQLREGQHGEQSRRRDMLMR